MTATCLLMNTLRKYVKSWLLESQYCVRFEPVYLLNSDFSFIIALFAPLCRTLTLFGQIAIKSRFIGSFLRLQKRAARVISYADRMTSSVALFNKLGWIPFYEQHKIDKCIIMYKRINGYLPSYVKEHFILNNKRHSRNTRFSSINAVCPKCRRETEGGRSFAVSATRLWNSTPIEIRKLDSVACFKKNMFAKIFKEQQCLHHFIILF